ncbi:MAG: tRNA (adenosine(37)-N6)-dimethylallyltransferase MiaA, partial [Patescibacteria group bacterium]
MKKNKTLPKIIVILGPTASGKSEMAVKIAKKFRGEIISADSRQIYKGIDVGTAKIAKKEMKGIPHHLLDVVSPDKILTLAQYQKQTLAAIKKILKKGKLPIICGGTGLYIQAMVDNLRIPEVPPNPKIRAKIEKEIARNGLAAIYKKLLKLDPECEKFIDPKNPRRIIRALEVCLITKKP